MNELQVIEMQGQRVLTSKQIAKMYGAEEWRIKQNFKQNKKKYVIEKHYIILEGEELKKFKARYEIHTSIENKVENFSIVGKTAKILYLWTEKGALLHAKSLNTDKAWEVYDYLVDYYFRTRQQASESAEQKQEIVQTKKELQLPRMKNPIKFFEVLLEVAKREEIEVVSYPFKANESILRNNKIGIRSGSTLEQVCYELAWELSHAFIHHDAGNLIESPLAKDYNKQADRAAEMIIEILNAST